ncbi:MAG: hypothetical protein Q9208_001103 [Pyrenodesmia sp. 3 TL-2023]
MLKPQKAIDQSQCRTTNRIVKAINYGSLIKAQKMVELLVATETETDTRTEEVARNIMGPDFKTAMEQHEDPLPEGTAKAVARDVWHVSKSDPKEHYDVVCQNAAGTYLETIHVKKPVGKLAAEGPVEEK